VLTGLILLLAHPLYAAQSTPAGPGTAVVAGAGLRQSQWHTYESIDGLPAQWVLGLAEDSQGRLWIATAGGLCRYDGRSFTIFTTQDGLPGNEISSVLVDDKDHVWMGTEHGLTRYDGEQFTTFTTQEGLPHDRVWALYQDREGGLWLIFDRIFPGTSLVGHGVTRYDGEQFTTFTAPRTACPTTMSRWCIRTKTASCGSAPPPPAVKGP
jgi:ligand-binding sensor domain-containing protein